MHLVDFYYKNINKKAARVHDGRLFFIRDALASILVEYNHFLFAEVRPLKEPLTLIIDRSNQMSNLKLYRTTILVDSSIYS